jgi:hypothetical protein
MTAIILERLRTEAQWAKNGEHPILARSFDLAIAEIERLTAALEIIAGRRACPDNLLGDKDVARLALEQADPSVKNVAEQSEVVK